MGSFVREQHGPGNEVVQLFGFLPFSLDIVFVCTKALETNRWLIECNSLHSLSSVVLYGIYAIPTNGRNDYVLAIIVSGRSPSQVDCSLQCWDRDTIRLSHLDYPYLYFLDSSLFCLAAHFRT
jgi:hypothetical protein